MPTNAVAFVAAVLATWRVTHLLAREDGPADVIVRFRARLGDGLAGALMDCFNCLSLWTAAAIAICVSRGRVDWALNWLALSGGASLIEALRKTPVIFEPVPDSREGAFHDVLR
jgi:hypothetical protein